jgi:ATP-dependent DNA ligase
MVEGAQRSGFGSLVGDFLLGQFDRHGFSAVASLASPTYAKSKLTKQVKKPKATWVEPSFFADVEYRDITSEGLLRQSSFKGLTKLRK